MLTQSIFLSKTLKLFSKLTAVARSTNLSVEGSPPEFLASGTFCRLPIERSPPEDPWLAEEGDRMLLDDQGM